MVGNVISKTEPMTDLSPWPILITCMVFFCASETVWLTQGKLHTLYFQSDTGVKVKADSAPVYVQ